jgi:hypothetical protein
MIQKFKYYLLTLVSALMVAMPVALPTSIAYADNRVCTSSGTANDVNKIGDAVSAGANGAAEGHAQSDCATSTGVDNNNVATLGHKVVNLFSIIIGVIAIIMIIYGGFRYITSGGASERVGSAKNTLIYAIVGLIIVALAQVIVHFVLNQANTALTG